jgi:hypothetical protein
MKTADGDAGRTAVRRCARGGKRGRAKPVQTATLPEEISATTRSSMSIEVSVDFSDVARQHSATRQC